MIRKKLKEFIKSNYLDQTFFFLILFLCVVVLDLKRKKWIPSWGFEPHSQNSLSPGVPGGGGGGRSALCLPLAAEQQQRLIFPSQLSNEVVVEIKEH